MQKHANIAGDSQKHQLVRQPSHPDCCPRAPFPVNEDRHRREVSAVNEAKCFLVHDEILQTFKSRQTLGCSLSIVNSSALCARPGGLRDQVASQQSFPFSSFACYLRRRRGNSVMSVNKVILVGRWAAIPETRYTGGGQPSQISPSPLTTLTKTKTATQKRTEWHRSLSGAKQAEIAQQYLKEGSLIFNRRAHPVREWQDKEPEAHQLRNCGQHFRMLGGRAAAPPQAPVAQQRSGGR